MAARVALNGPDCIGRSVLTEHACGHGSGILCATARRTADIRRQKAARARHQEAGPGAVDEPLVRSGIVACPPSAVGRTPTTVADDDPSAVTTGYETERGRVPQTVRQAGAVPGRAASPR